MTKIVYLIQQPLDQRNYDRLGIQTWLDRGWSVEVWDVTPWVLPRVWETYIQSGRTLRVFPGYFAIESVRQLQERYAAVGKIAYYIDLTGDSWRTLRVKLALARRGAVRITCALSSIPEETDDDRGGFWSRARKALAKGPLKSSHQVVHSLVQRLCAPAIRPGVMVVSGEVSIPLPRNDCMIIKAHNFDFDIYLRLLHSAAMGASDYVVFIDQNYCFHPDFISLGIPPVTTPDRYFPAVNRFLSAVAGAAGVKIRIAAHPRAAFRQHDSPFLKEWPLEYGKTAELIRGSRGVVCHNSTANQFAVLFRKPVIFVTTDELARTYAGVSIDKSAQELGKSVINMDRRLDAVDWDAQFHVDPEKYDAYRNKFIKTDASPQLPLWEIVINHIAGNPLVAPMDESPA